MVIHLPPKKTQQQQQKQKNKTRLLHFYYNKNMVNISTGCFGDYAQVYMLFTMFLD